MVIKRCKSCRDGRLIKTRRMVFCGFCGKEYNTKKMKW